MNKILLITMLCLSMTACGGPSAGPETSEAAIASTPEIFAASTAEISEAESLIDTSNDTEKNILRRSAWMTPQRIIWKNPLRPAWKNQLN